MTKKLGYVLLFLLLLLEFFYTNNHHFLPFFFKLLVCGTIAIFLFFANENRSRQFGPYLWWALGNCEDMLLVREDRSVRTAGVSVVPPGAMQSSYVRQG